MGGFRFVVRIGYAESFLWKRSSAIGNSLPDKRCGKFYAWAERKSMESECLLWVNFGLSRPALPRPLSGVKRKKSAEKRTSQFVCLVLGHKRKCWPTPRNVRV
jgi:hypothetical protein